MRKFLSVMLAIMLTFSLSFPYLHNKTVTANGTTLPPIVKIVMPSNNTTILVGDEFYVNAVITNPNSDLLTGDAVIDPGDKAALVQGDVATKAVKVSGYGVSDVWWKLKCTKPGNTTITVTFKGVSDSIVVKQYQPPPQIGKKIRVEIIEAPVTDPNNSLDPCTDFVIKAKITNLTTTDIDNTWLEIDIEGPASLTNGDPERWNLGKLLAGKSKVVAWNLHCDGDGEVTITVFGGGDGVSEEEVLYVNNVVVVYQGEPEEPPPPPPGPLDVVIQAPDKVCTNCDEHNFSIYVTVTNNTGETVESVTVKIEIIQGSDKAYFDTDPNPTEQNLGDLDNGEQGTAQFDVVCVAEGPVKFKITVDSDDTDPQYEYVTVQQKAVLVNITQAQVEDDDPVENPGQIDVMVCNDFSFTAKVSNCTCIPYAYVTVLPVVQREDGTFELIDFINGADNVEWDRDLDGTGPDDAKLYIHVKQYNDQGVVVAKFDIPINAENPNGRFIITSLCPCCEYEFTWYLHCKAPSVDKIHVLAFQGTYPTNYTLLDSDMFKVRQYTDPEITKGIFFFPGWYSNETLRFTPGKGLIEREEYAVTQNWTAVIVVSNFGGLEATDVTITINATGDFDYNGKSGYLHLAHLAGSDSSDDDEINFGQGPITFNLGTIKPGESKKIILEGHCNGPNDVTLSVANGGITGINPVTKEPLYDNPNTGEPTDIHHTPNSETIKQIPIKIIWMNPEESSLDVSSIFAVKVKIKNEDQGTNAEDLEGVHVKLMWTGDAELWQNSKQEKELVGIPAGEEREVSWVMHCTGDRDVTFWLEIWFESTDLRIEKQDFGDEWFPFKNLAQIPPPPPKIYLDVDILSPAPGSIYGTGQIFAVTATITNLSTSDLPAQNVDIEFLSDSVAVDPTSDIPEEITISSLGIGKSVTLTWTVRCIEPNDWNWPDFITITANTQYADPADDTIWVWQYPAAYLYVEITEQPEGEITLGSKFEIKGRVCNLGWADATQVKLRLKDSNESVAFLNGTVLNLGTIPGMHGREEPACKEFTIRLQCKKECASTIEIVPEGKDEYGWNWKFSISPSWWMIYSDVPDWNYWALYGVIFMNADIPNYGMGDSIEEAYVTIKQVKPEVTDYIRVTYPYDDSWFGTEDTIEVKWVVNGFATAKLLGAKVRVLFYNGSTWEIVAQNLPLESGSFDIDLSSKTIVDPLRVRVRVGVYNPATGMWLTDGSKQFYDEVGHFWVTDSAPTKFIKTTAPTGLNIFHDNDSLTVTWDVEGFAGTEGKIRVLFYSGKAWHFVAYDLPLQDGFVSFNLSTFTIEDPMRCRVRVGVYVPDPAGSQYGLWYGEGDQLFYDESGHFWVLP